MSDKKIWRVIAATAVFFMLGAYGCILNPADDPQPIDPIDIVWPDLTERDDCIETILLLYNNYNRVGDRATAVNEHYATMLYDDPEGSNDYVWYMSEADQHQPGDPAILTRAEDIEGTIYLLTNASQMSMTIPVTPWINRTDVCADCWMTTRQYTYNCTISHKGELLSFHGDTVEIEFVVRPHHNDPNKWALYQASDKKTF